MAAVAPPSYNADAAGDAIAQVLALKPTVPLARRSAAAASESRVATARVRKGVKRADKFVAQHAVPKRPDNPHLEVRAPRRTTRPAAAR
jgi:hypothetical protein